MKLEKNARIVLEKRYLQKDEDGNLIETVEQLFGRVAHAVSQADANYGAADEECAELKQRFYERMTNLEFLPNSPTLMNAGRELGQLSACFVLPIGDSMEEIFEAIKQAALIHKSGGGTGFSFSRLRPCGAAVKTTGGVASGPISFMRVFNMATEAVKQGGTRRGANMGILRVDHPDILSFIDCKKDNADITNFNISVGITEAFMRAVQAGECYPLIDPHNGRQTGELQAKDVFDRIVESAWRNGEPGILFLDRINRDNPVPAQGEIESTNPCGEQPLLPFESCNLGSINLSKMLAKKDGKFEIDEEKLKAVVHDAVHFLDNVIDINKYPLKEIEETTKQTRKIGLGVMGWADMIARMGIPYDSDEAVELARKLMGFIRQEGHNASKQLAKARGPFPLFSQSIYAGEEPLRNAAVTTIAPTGTLSIIAGCSSGVEPVFAHVFIRNIMDGTEMIEVNPVLKEVLEERGLYNIDLMNQIAAQGSLRHVDGLPDDVKRVFASAHDISPLYHIKMQAAFQQGTDNAVSKTVNFAHKATMEEVREVFELAYELGCKGVTIYRDGSRDSQVLNIGSVKKEADKREAPCPTGLRPRPRPPVMCGLTERVQIGCGNLYVTVNYDEHGICEVFTSTGKAGGCPSQSEATARLASIALRSGVSVDEVLKQLRGIRCPSTIRRADVHCTSCPDAIARVVEKTVEMLKQQKQSGEVPSPPKGMGMRATQRQNELPGQIHYCPECGEKLEHEGGCVSCRSCGYSRCN